MPKRGRSRSLNELFIGNLFFHLRRFLKVGDMSHLSASSVAWERYLCNKKEWPLTHRSNPKFSQITSMHVARTMDEYMMDNPRLVSFWPPSLTCLTLGHWAGAMDILAYPLPHTIKKLSWTTFDLPTQWPNSLTYLTLTDLNRDKLECTPPDSLIYLRIHLQDVSLTLKHLPSKLEHLELGYSDFTPHIMTALSSLSFLSCVVVIGNLDYSFIKGDYDVFHEHGSVLQKCNVRCKGPRDGSCKHSWRSRFPTS